jgi:hypothetical protein
VRTIEEIRHANLLVLLARYESVRALADALGINYDQILQWKNRHTRPNGKPYTPDSSSARKIEATLNLEVGWMDNDHAAPAGSPLLPSDIARWERLDSASQAHIQQFLSIAITQREQYAAPPLHTGGDERAAHQLHDSGKRYGT